MDKWDFFGWLVEKAHGQPSGIMEALGRRKCDFVATEGEEKYYTESARV